MQQSSRKPIDIPVQLAPAETGPAGAVLRQVLRDVEAMLEALVSCGETGSVDLKRSPLDREELARLREVLGRGEVAATLECLGETRVAETAVRGVWWISHHDENGGTVGEFLEVTACPELLVTDPRDLQLGLERLNKIVADQPGVIDPDLVAKSVAALGLCSTDFEQASVETATVGRRHHGE